MRTEVLNVRQVRNCPQPEPVLSGPYKNSLDAKYGLSGYEIIADGKTADNQPKLIYQVMLFNDKGDYYIILGHAKENMESNLETYRKIAKTFKRK